MTWNRNWSDSETQIGWSNGWGLLPFEKKLGIETVRTFVAYVRNIENQPIPVPQIKTATGSEASSDNGDVKSVYSAKCSHCHGADGAGNTVLGRALKLRDMRSPEAQKFSEAEVITIIASGTDGGRMPGFRKKLGPEMVTQLASYVRGLAGNPPIDVTKKLSSTEPASEPAPSEPVKPAVQAKDKTILTVQARKTRAASGRQKDGRYA